MWLTYYKYKWNQFLTILKWTVYKFKRCFTTLIVNKRGHFVWLKVTNRSTLEFSDLFLVCYICPVSLRRIQSGTDHDYNFKRHFNGKRYMYMQFNINILNSASITKTYFFTTSKTITINITHEYVTFWELNIYSIVIHMNPNSLLIHIHSIPILLYICISIILSHL